MSIISIGIPIPDRSALPGQTGGEVVEVNLQYATQNYCDGTGIFAPTVATPAGGVFTDNSSDPNLFQVNSANGTFNLGVSDPGNYIVTYTVSGVGSANFPINITALDNAAFSYSASAFCADASNQTPTITTPGGTFTTQDITFRPFQMQFEVASGVEKIIEVSCTSTGNFTIDWGDNSTILNNYTTGTITHTYNAGNVGTTVDPVISFGDINDTGVLTNATHTASSRSDLIDVPQWGGMEFYRFAFSSRFQSCNNSRFQISATDAPNIETPVGSMKRLFRYANSAFNSDISHWDADVGSSFELAFTNITSFNQSLNSWDVSNATNLYGVFYGASSFDQYLGDWDIQTSGLYLFRDSGMSTENYTDTFVSWANKVYNNSAPYNLNFGTQSGMFFDRARSGGANFADAGAARDYLTGVTANWTITGDTEIN